MKLNHNSLSARLYRWFYITDHMPPTLCPYFWKLVLMWILILPYSFLCLPLIIVKQDEEILEWRVRPIFGVVLYGVVFVTFLALFPLTYFIWGLFEVKSVFLQWQVAGMLIWVIIIVYAIVWAIVKLNSRRKLARRRRQLEYIWNDKGDYVLNPDYVHYEPRPNIIVEFIKAKYNKYCPKIDWED